MDDQTQAYPQRDLFCDLGELSCGDLVMALMKTLRPLPPKAVLEVRALDTAAPVDIYAWCKLTGHTLLSGPCGPDNVHFFIQKKE